MRMVFASPWPLALLAALSWLAVGGDAAAVCDSTGQPAPTGPTFMASKNKPADGGWIVQPNCEFTAVDLMYTRDGYALLLYSEGIERVASAPTNVKKMNLVDNPLSQGADFSSASNLQTLYLSTFSPKLVDNLILPKTAKEVHLLDSAFTSMDNVILPEGLQSLVIGPSTLRSFDNVVLPASLQYLSLEDLTLAALDNAKFPDRLQTLVLTAPLKSVDSVKFPAFLLTLFLLSHSTTSLRDVKFPSTLKYLVLETNSPRLDFAFPNKVETLRVENSPVRVLERVNFPDSLINIDVTSCNTTVVKGIKWPSKLQELSISPNPITTFEIRQSDVQLFESLSSSSGMDLSRSVCTDPTGNLTTVNKVYNWKMCVISDERFTELYGNPEIVLPSPSPSVDDPASGSDGNGDDSPDEPSETSQTQRPVEASGSGSTDPSEDWEIAFPGVGKKTRKPTTRIPGTETVGSATEGFEFSDETGTNSSTRSSRRSNSTSSKSSTKSKEPDGNDESVEVIEVHTPLGQTMVVAAVVAGVVLALIVLCFGVRRLLVASRNRENSKNDYSTLDTPTSTNWFSSSHAGIATAASAVAAGGICNDKLLRAFRLKQSDVLLKKTVSRQGYGEVFHGVYNGRDVAVKRIQPAFSSDEQVMASFEEEIRMCAGLDHPKIVAFIGIAWSNERDLSAIVEFMAGGDLETLLHSHQQPSVGRDWSALWTASHIKSKASIALDVAEALVYLHGSKTLITHRDLRARNVQLDGEGNAKLNAFAINRSSQLDETMQGGVDSVAWMAPEVLMGEVYTEKADIYAFGVLLVELDRCRHPFPTNAVVDSEDADGSIVAEHMDTTSQKSIQVAVQVCSGDLRPTVSTNCPERVAALVAKCLSFDAVDRPSAREVLAELRVISDGLEK